MERSDVLETLKKYIEETIILDAHVSIDPDTPLLDWDILNSISTTRLVAFVWDHYGVEVPPGEMLGANFRNLTAITELVCRLGEVKEDGLAGR